MRQYLNATPSGGGSIRAPLITKGALAEQFRTGCALATVKTIRPHFRHSKRTSSPNHNTPTAAVHFGTTWSSSSEIFLPSEVRDRYHAADAGGGINDSDRLTCLPQKPKHVPVSTLRPASRKQMHITIPACQPNCRSEAINARFDLELPLVHNGQI